MSKYMAFENELFSNHELLIESLKTIGFEKIDIGTDLPLEGWDKSNVKLADIVIRRSEVSEHRLLGDFGFQKTKLGYIAIVDDMDLNYSLGKDFITRLQTQYHEAAARKMAKKLGGTIKREQIGKTIKIRIKY